MAPIIDLTLDDSDSEPDESLGQKATAALNSFQPRKQRPVSDENAPVHTQAHPSTATSLWKVVEACKTRFDRYGSVNKVTTPETKFKYPQTEQHMVVERPAPPATFPRPAPVFLRQADENGSSRSSTSAVQSAYHSISQEQFKSSGERRRLTLTERVQRMLWKGDEVAQSGNKKNAPNGTISPTTVISGGGIAIIDSAVTPGNISQNGIGQSKRKAPTQPGYSDQTEEQSPTKKRRLGGVGTDTTLQIDQELGSTVHSPPKVNGSNIQTAVSVPPTLPTAQSQVQPQNRYNLPWSAEEDDLLFKLKDDENLSWADTVKRFCSIFVGRTPGTIQVRYSVEKKKRAMKGNVPRTGNVQTSHRCPICQQYFTRQDNMKRHLSLHTEEKSFACKIPGCGKSFVRSDLLHLHESDHNDQQSSDGTPRRRTQRNGGKSVTEGFVSWAQVKAAKAVAKAVQRTTESVEVEERSVQEPNSISQQDHTHVNTISRILRQRELGNNSGRGWASFAKTVNDELTNLVLDRYKPKAFFTSTSGDVTCLAWSGAWASGKSNKFAVGSIAITDDRSMQYNNSCNLLLGNYDEEELFELPEHHIPRPVIEKDPANVNSFHAMRETQDSRLFTSVTALEFSPSGDELFTAGHDNNVHAFQVGRDIRQSKLRYTIPHSAHVDIMSVSKVGILATACHMNAGPSIGVYQCQEATWEHTLKLSPSETPALKGTFPSALKWGVAPRHHHLLLAGLSNDDVNDEDQNAGGTALWDVETGQRLFLTGVCPNVFDVTWNPNASSASTSFAVASMRGSNKLDRGMRSLVQCYAPHQYAYHPVLQWQCRASDINDVIYCPHDINIIAAGATDGKVYVWDKRFANRRQTPLHVLEHGHSVSVLDHDRKREEADTGVRFLSWGATSSRLYSGSSDGIVKVWNPYRSTESAHVDDVATFSTAIMSGSFSPDHRDLLVGEESGRLNLLTLDYQGHSIRNESPRRFKLHSAPEPKQAEAEASSATEMISTEQIQLVPMGALPIRQAVQGPNYDGPYMMPKPEQWRHAQTVYNEAINKQNEAYGVIAMSSSQTSETGIMLREADLRVRAALNAMNDLQTRSDAAVKLGQKASAYQRALKAQRAEHVNAAALDSQNPCLLDCNYLPKNNEEGADAPDSERSKGRIPGALRATPRGPLDISSFDCKQLFEAGLAGQCSVCSVPCQGKQLVAFNKIRCKQRCTTIKAKLARTCERCKAPIQTINIGQGSNFCERCEFACFRCGGPAEVSPRATYIHCTACRLSWVANLLGYEFEGHEYKAAKTFRPQNEDKEEDDDYLDDSELEHYASLWQ
ncbi:WD40 repeat-like protein [Acrodontium crateriforme]|uniref:WD40 repeat-like protein n=1 Tax=Acrodontium crateriforme TaxID=150365 RepID=A0AAQ3RBW0_9PEZI|nr:WD40 repeat-like protein [Acrodontium crateriforme]